MLRSLSETCDSALYKFRWAGCAATGRPMYRDFTFILEKVVHNDAALVWAIEVLKRRPHA
jgi:hypothetical protein